MNKEIKRKNRALNDKKETYEIIQKSKFLHLGLNDDDYPYIVPLYYGFEYSASNDTFIFYMHGAKAGHKIDLIKKSPKAFVEIETDVALITDNKNPCLSDSFYSSFMGRGTATLVEDAQEKKRGLQLLMLHQTDKSFEFTEQMIAAVSVIKVTVTEYTAKAKKHL